MGDEQLNPILQPEPHKTATKQPLQRVGIKHGEFHRLHLGKTMIKKK